MTEAMLLYASYSRRSFFPGPILRTWSLLNAPPTGHRARQTCEPLSPLSIPARYMTRAPGQARQMSSRSSSPRSRWSSCVVAVSGSGIGVTLSHDDLRSCDRGPVPWSSTSDGLSRCAGRCAARARGAGRAPLRRARACVAATCSFRRRPPAAPASPKHAESLLARERGREHAALQARQLGREDEASCKPACMSSALACTPWREARLHPYKGRMTIQPRPLGAR